jgi:hypothetical protein
MTDILVVKGVRDCYISHKGGCPVRPRTVYSGFKGQRFNQIKLSGIKNSAHISDRPVGFEPTRDLTICSAQNGVPYQLGEGRPEMWG